MGRNRNDVDASVGAAPLRASLMSFCRAAGAVLHVQSRVFLNAGEQIFERENYFVIAIKLKRRELMGISYIAQLAVCVQSVILMNLNDF